MISLITQPHCTVVVIIVAITLTEAVNWFYKSNTHTEQRVFFWVSKIFTVRVVAYTYAQSPMFSLFIINKLCLSIELLCNWDLKNRTQNQLNFFFIFTMDDTKWIYHFNVLFSRLLYATILFPSYISFLRGGSVSLKPSVIFWFCCATSRMMALFSPVRFHACYLL